MKANAAVIGKNVDTFATAYGLDAKAQALADDILEGDGHVESVGVLLRDPVTKRGLLSCQFPLDEDITNDMIWVPVDERSLEAVPIYTREAGLEHRLRSFFKRLKTKATEENFFEIAQGKFTLRVHESFSKEGVIDKYFPLNGYGFIRRSRTGIYFIKEWCNLEHVVQGKVVSFIPIISRRGLQARAVQEARS
jgi:hypothetical protein